jgi:hypothetical protein
MTQDDFVRRAGDRFFDELTQWSYTNPGVIPDERVMRFYKGKALVDALFDLWETNPRFTRHVPRARRMYHARVAALMDLGLYDDDVQLTRIALEALDEAAKSGGRHGE